MFTGIIEEIGRIVSVRHGAHSAVLGISADKVLEGTAIGDSIAVNGVCLTVTALENSGFSADVMPQTLRRSALQHLRPGSPVNLEGPWPPEEGSGGISFPDIRMPVAAWYRLKPRIMQWSQG